MTEILRLLDTVTVAAPTRPDEPTLVVRGTRVLRIRNADGTVDAALSRLRDGVAATELADGLAAQLVTALDRLGWLTREQPHREGIAGWDRQAGWWATLTSTPREAQRRLAASRVAVLGLGGVGALVAQHLVAGGVQQLWLVDYDTVAAHNLNRTYLYRRNDIGRPKTEAAAESLSGLADDLELRLVPLRVERPADLDRLSETPELLVVAADTPRDLMDTVWRWAQPHGVPVLGAGVGLESGYWGPMLDPRRGHCWFCVEEDRQARLTADERRLEAAASPTPYSFGPTNALIADLVARDSMLFLALGRCPSLGRRQVIDVLGIGTEPLEPAPVPGPAGGCRIHAEGKS